MRPAMSSRPPRATPRPGPVESHTFAPPHVVELPRPVGPDAFDASVW